MAVGRLIYPSDLLNGVIVFANHDDLLLQLTPPLQMPKTTGR